MTVESAAVDRAQFHFTESTIPIRRTLHSSGVRGLSSSYDIGKLAIKVLSIIPTHENIGFEKNVPVVSYLPTTYACLGFVGMGPRK